MPKLALYMGHVSIESSAYYLHWVPSLRSLASNRFEQKFGRLVEGGALKKSAPHQLGSCFVPLLSGISPGAAGNEPAYHTQLP